MNFQEPIDLEHMKDMFHTKRYTSEQRSLIGGVKMHIEQISTVDRIDEDLALKSWSNCIKKLKCFSSLREQISRTWERLNKKQVILAALSEGKLSNAIEEFNKEKELLTDEDREEIFANAPVLKIEGCFEK